MATPAWGRYEELRPAEIEAIRSAFPLAYVPWGALEWHSLHAPVGLDSFKAHGVCCALAEVTGGVVLPAVPFATETIKPYKGFPHSLEFSAELVGRLCEALAGQLADEKFKVVVILTGHYPPGHVNTLTAAAARTKTLFPDADFHVVNDGEFLRPEFKPDHAGLTETSLLAALQPGLISLERLPRDRGLTLDADGITGDDPRQATAEAGRARLAQIVARAAPQVKAWLARHTL